MRTEKSFHELLIAFREAGASRSKKEREEVERYLRRPWTYADAQWVCSKDANAITNRIFAWAFENGLIPKRLPRLTRRSSAAA
jgi:hypothetical protein